MRFDVRSESVPEFVPNNLVDFVGRKLLSPFPNSGSPYPVGAWPGDDTAQVGGNSVCKTIRSRPPRKGAQWPASWVDKEHGISVQIMSIWRWVDEPSYPCKNARTGILYYIRMDNLSQSGRAAWGGRRGPGLLTSSRPWRDSRPEATA